MYTGTYFQAPTGAGLPFIGNLLDDLSHIPEKAIAKHLGISLRTLRRYKASNNAPKVVCIALYVESSWCRRGLDIGLQNEIAHHSMTVRIRDRQIEQLLRHVALLEQERERAISGTPRAANSPFFATSF